VKAAFMTAPNRIEVMDAPTPQPQAGEVLLAVKAVAICASDIHIFEYGHSSGVYPTGPLILGHEFSGQVAQLGPDVTDLQVGDRVACEPSWHCGHCDMCLQGLTNLCRNVVFPSFPDTNGAMAEYIVTPAHALCKLPNHVSYEAGALVEPLGVGLHAVRLSGLQKGQDVAILGAGAIGVAILDVCLWWGAQKLYMVEPLPGRQAFPEKLGAQVFDSAQQLQATLETDGSHPAVVFEAAGAPTSFSETMPLVRPAGTAVIVGIPEPDEQRFQASIPRRKELTVQFSRRSRNTLEDGVALAAANQIHLEQYPTRQFTLDQAAEAMQAAIEKQGDMIRAIVTP
jgi:L-iditol 2-dehydrogenase